MNLDFIAFTLFFAAEDGRSMYSRILCSRYLFKIVIQEQNKTNTSIFRIKLSKPIVCLLCIEVVLNCVQF